MKKVMIGILIFIPILIVLIVAMVTSIVSITAWIGVDDVYLYYKNQEVEAEQITFSLEEVADKVLNIYDYVDISVYPEKANNYQIEWSVAGTFYCTDEDYEKEYNDYRNELSSLISALENEYASTGTFEDEDKLSAYESVKSDYSNDTSMLYHAMAQILLPEVRQVFSFVGADGDSVTSNTSGDFIIASYGYGTIQVSAENVSKTLLISVGGDDVQSATITGKDGQNSLRVGESMRLVANYTPLTSIVNNTLWISNNSDIATIDSNGVITALKEGEATFTLKAGKHSSERSGGIQYVVSNTYTVSVVQSDGLSAKYANTVTVSNNSDITLEALGISNVDNVIGASIVDGVLHIQDGVDVVTISANNKTFTINVCDHNAIAIENARFYDNESGYVVAVGEQSLILNAVWKDALRTDMLEDVEWTSSDTDVATVSNGVVKGVSSGLVTITARKDSAEVEITLNVQRKVAMLQLRTSDESLAVGLARETVFASYNFEHEDISDGKDTVVNYVDIKILGEPKRDSDMTTEQYLEKLAYFYDSYTFEIYTGGGYAYFDNNQTNRLVFNPEALEGEGKQEIKIKVSAKYPKYEGISRYISEEVTIKVIYGVSVYNVAQLEYASKMQKEYCQFNNYFELEREGESAFEGQNIQISQLGFEHTVVNGDESESYIVRLDPTSLRTYAICLMANCCYGDGVDRNNLKTLAYVDNRLSFFGDVYGNNRIISALQGQMGKSDVLMRISWSGITLSNIVIRANDLGDNAEISTDETKTFVSSVAGIGSQYDTNVFHLTDVKFEYCILENGRELAYMPNADVTFDGCVIRNFISAGLHAPQKVSYIEDCYYMMYSHITLNNVTCSNMLASLISATYKSYTVGDKNKNRFVKNGTKEENNAYFMEHFYKYGINFELTQTGFFNAYNWQKVDSLSIIDTGDEKVNEALGSVSASLVSSSSSFDDFIYHDSRNEAYFHTAFVVIGINTSGTIASEPTFANVKLEDSRLNSIHVGSIDASAGGLFSTAKKWLSTMYIYAYKNDANIKPGDTYVINSDFIDQLH